VPMKVLTPHDDVVDASELERPEDFPKIGFLPAPSSGPLAFCIASGEDAAHWDNPDRRPFGLYEIEAPGASRKFNRCSMQALTQCCRVRCALRCAGTYVLTRGRITRLMDLQLNGDAANAAEEQEEQAEETEVASQMHQAEEAAE
jgi:hypothetical protein